MSVNTIRNVRRVRAGEPHIAHTPEGLWARQPAPEDGFVVEMADCHVFVPDRLLRAARRERRRADARTP